MARPLYPRVTQILCDLGLDPDFSGVPAGVLEAARKRGTAVHEAMEAMTYGFLDNETPEIAPYLCAARKFLSESGYVPEVAEVQVVNDTWRYRGHLDNLGMLQTRRAIVDWKTADSLEIAYASYQLAGYFDAWNTMHPTTPAQAAVAVQLRSDGTYRVWEIDLAAAMPVWRAAVTVHYARRRSP
ncbi:MAG: hypothetical protein ACREK6_22005 [Candidatus Rokuibacteriota bacterium]